MFLESPDLSRKFFEMYPQGFGHTLRVKVRVAVYVLERGDNYLSVVGNFNKMDITLGGLL